MIFNNKVVNDPKTIAEEMNNHFINKINDLKAKDAERNKAHEQDFKELKEYLIKTGYKKSFRLKEIDDDKYDKIIKRMKGKRSTGLDWICGYSLKLSATVLREQLKHIVNLSIATKKIVIHGKNQRSFLYVKI